MPFRSWVCVTVSVCHLLFSNRIFQEHLIRKDDCEVSMTTLAAFKPTNAFAMHDSFANLKSLSVGPAHHLFVLTFFFFGSSSSLPFPSSPSASAISSSLPLLSCAESYSSATSDSEPDWKSSSRLSSSSSAEPRSTRAATTSSSEELMSASLRAAWMRAED